jgi:Zn-dependent peptidase ImmA (M78 family)/DNA-binding XRE family transcriptional regulator
MAICNGDMLRLARQRMGFQQSDAAEHLSVTQSTLSRYESEVSDPDTSFIQKAAKLYNFPPDFFAQSFPGCSTPLSVHPYFRKKKDVTARDVDRISAELNLRALHANRVLERIEIQPSLKLPEFESSQTVDPEKIAIKLRTDWKLGDGPIQSLTRLAEQAGIWVFLYPLVGISVSGVTLSVKGSPPIIILNSEHPADRLRFTLAHEIGHLIMHRNPSLHLDEKDLEDQANSFAGAFLMPASALKKVIPKDLSLGKLAELKLEWKCAMAALHYRAKQLDLISEQRSKRLYQQFSMHKIRLREPASLDFPKEEPTLVTKIFKAFMDAMKFQSNSMAKYLHVTEADFMETYGFQKNIPKIKINT